MTDVDSEKDDLWEQYKDSFDKKEVAGKVIDPRPSHIPDSLSKLLPQNSTHAQFPAWVNPQHIRYDKHGDMIVSLTVPKDYSHYSLQILGMMGKLVSVDMIPYPLFDPNLPIEDQGFHNA